MFFPETYLKKTKNFMIIISGILKKIHENCYHGNLKEKTLVIFLLLSRELDYPFPGKSFHGSSWKHHGK